MCYVPGANLGPFLFWIALFLYANLFKLLNIKGVLTEEEQEDFRTKASAGLLPFKQIRNHFYFIALDLHGSTVLEESVFIKRDISEKCDIGRSRQIRLAPSNGRKSRGSMQHYCILVVQVCLVFIVTLLTEPRHLSKVVILNVFTLGAGKHDSIVRVVF